MLASKLLCQAAKVAARLERKTGYSDVEAEAIALVRQSPDELQRRQEEYQSGYYANELIQKRVPALIAFLREANQWQNHHS